MQKGIKPPIALIKFTLNGQSKELAIQQIENLEQDVRNFCSQHNLDPQKAPLIENMLRQKMAQQKQFNESIESTKTSLFPKSKVEPERIPSNQFAATGSLLCEQRNSERDSESILQALSEAEDYRRLEKGGTQS